MFGLSRDPAEISSTVTDGTKYYVLVISRRRENVYIYVLYVIWNHNMTAARLDRLRRFRFWVCAQVARLVVHAKPTLVR